MEIKKRNYLTYILLGVIIILIIMNFILMENQRAKPATKEIIKEYEVSSFNSDLARIIEESSDKLVTINNNEVDITGIIYDYLDENGLATIVSINSNKEPALITFSNGVSATATPITLNNPFNIAIYQIPVDFRVTPFNRGDSELTKKGQQVVTLNKTNDYRESFDSFVTFINKDRIYDDKLITTSVNLSFDSSLKGAPVINAAGELIGISKGDNTDIYLPINLINIIVDQNLNEQKDVNKIELGLSFYEIVKMPVYLRSQLDIELSHTDGIYIDEVHSNSIAFNLGILQGDIIKEINDRSISTVYDFYSAIYSIENIDDIKMKVQRGENEISLESQGNQ